MILGFVLVFAACGGPDDSSEEATDPDTVGDVSAGEVLFNTPMEEIPAPVDLACATCHSLDGVDARSPTLLGISEVAGQRVDGLSDVDYLRQSITEPQAYLAGEWSSIMPGSYADVLTEEEIDNLVAFLLTQ